MDPIANTAYFTCGARAADAESAAPLCGDHLAERFMDADARRVFARFAGLRGPNASVTARHRMIDDVLREVLREDPDRHVFLLGAGFDTRPFRLPGGRWVELDSPALMARKETILPAASAPNPLTRIALDFSAGRLAHELAPWRGRPAIVVMEGVSMYLTREAWRSTLDALRSTLPGHTLLCDLMTRSFARFFGRPLRQRIAELGGDFAPIADDPRAVFRDAGYRERSAASIPGFAFARGSRWIPRQLTPPWLVRTALRPLRDGYRLHVFDAPSTARGELLVRRGGGAASKPRVVLLGWAHASASQLRVFERLHGALGGDALTVLSPFGRQLLRAEAYARGVTEIAHRLAAARGARPTIVHLFSDAGFLSWAALLAELASTRDGRSALAAVRGVIFDSAPAMWAAKRALDLPRHLAVGLSSLLAPLLGRDPSRPHAILTPIFALGFLAYQAAFRGDARRIVASARRVRALQPARPHLFLYGAEDRLVRPGHVRAWIASQGADVRCEEHEFRDASHVGLYASDPERYRDLVGGFVRRALGGEPGDRRRAKSA